LNGHGRRERPEEAGAGPEEVPGDLRSSLTLSAVAAPLVVWARLKLQLPWPATIVITGIATSHTVMEAVNVVVLGRKIREAG
jgi:hypothetical protein